MPENLTPLAPEKAYSLAERLTTIPDFPNRDQAIQAVAEWLLDYCTVKIIGSDGEENRPVLARAVWLIREATTERPVGVTWQGVGELKSRYDAKYRPGLPIWNEPSKQRCPRCWDTGLVNYADSLARVCDCPAGDKRSDDPQALQQLLNELNASSLCVTITRATGIRKVSQSEAELQEEIDRIKEVQRQNRLKGGAA
jgi:hypothetical protein